MELNQTASDLIVCCNGASPYAHVRAGWVAEDFHFEQFRFNATFPGLNTTSSPRCLGYLLKLNSGDSTGSWLGANGSLGCRCKRDFYGRHCVDQRAAHGAGGQAGGSFKVFLFLAIVPLTFGLIAAIGGLLCKLCCCQCRWADGGENVPGAFDGDEMSASGDTLGLCWCCFYAEDELADDRNLRDSSPSPQQTGWKSPWGRRRPVARLTSDLSGDASVARSDATTAMLLAPTSTFDLPPPTYRQLFAFDPPAYDASEEPLRDATTQTNL